MTIEITLEDADGEITVILDNHLVLKATRDNNQITFGKSFSRIDDEETYQKMKAVVTTLLTPLS